MSDLWYCGELCALLLLTALLTTGPIALGQSPRTVRSAGNPILADGSYYSADPAPLVVGDTLYILAGRDEAAAEVNDFIMNEWQMFATKDVASRRWLHSPGFLRPESVFHWAAPGHAYAGQIVQGTDGRFYMYAPVQEAESKNADAFAIGVAVADKPLGPWKDAHPSGPIVSQSVPVPNRIQNIDPTAMVDDDGRVYLYWGTFGKLRGLELAADMVTPKSEEIAVATLDGFFEAPWIFKRKGIYYMHMRGTRLALPPRAHQPYTMRASHTVPLRHRLGRGRIAALFLVRSRPRHRIPASLCSKVSGISSITRPMQRGVTTLDEAWRSIRLRGTIVPPLRGCSK